MKKINLYQIFCILTFLNCICFLISNFICFNFLVEIKTLVLLCSIFSFGIIISYTGFYFSYKKYKSNIKSNKKDLKIYILDFNSKKSA